MKHSKHEIEWEADENMWGGVIAMINSGTEAIESVISRQGISFINQISYIDCIKRDKKLKQVKHELNKSE